MRESEKRAHTAIVVTQPVYGSVKFCTDMQANSDSSVECTKLHSLNVTFRPEGPSSGIHLHVYNNALKFAITPFHNQSNIDLFPNTLDVNTPTRNMEVSLPVLTFGVHVW